MYLNKIPSFFLICSCIDEHLYWFINILISGSAINMAVWVSLGYADFEFFGYTQWYYSCLYDICVFSVLRNVHTDFHSGSTCSHSLSSVERSLFPRPSSTCLLQDASYLSGMWWDLDVILTFISLMAKDTDHFPIFMGQILFLPWELSVKFLNPFIDGWFESGV